MPGRLRGTPARAQERQAAARARQPAPWSTGRGGLAPLARALGDAYGLGEPAVCTRRRIQQRAAGPRRPRARNDRRGEARCLVHRRRNGRRRRHLLPGLDRRLALARSESSRAREGRANGGSPDAIGCGAATPHLHARAHSRANRHATRQAARDGDCATGAQCDGATDHPRDFSGPSPIGLRRRKRVRADCPAERSTTRSSACRRGARISVNAVLQVGPSARPAKEPA